MRAPLLGNHTHKHKYNYGGIVFLLACIFIGKISFYLAQNNEELVGSLNPWDKVRAKRREKSQNAFKLVTEMELDPDAEELDFFKCAFEQITSEKSKLGKADFEVKKHFLTLVDDVKMGCIVNKTLSQVPRFVNETNFAKEVADFFQNQDGPEHAKVENIYQNYDAMINRQVMDMKSEDVFSALKALESRLEFRKKHSKAESLFKISARFMDGVPLSKVYAISFGIVSQVMDNIQHFSLTFPGSFDGADLIILYLTTDQDFTDSERVRQTQKLVQIMRPHVGKSIDPQGTNLPYMEFKFGRYKAKHDDHDTSTESANILFEQKYGSVIKREFPDHETFELECNHQLDPVKCVNIKEDPDNGKFELGLFGEEEKVKDAMHVLQSSGLFLPSFPHLTPIYKDNRKFLRLSDIFDGIPFRRSLVMSLLSFLFKRPVISPMDAEFDEYLKKFNSDVRNAVRKRLKKDICFSRMKDITLSDVRPSMDEDLEDTEYQRRCLEHFSALWLSCGHVVSSFWDGQMPHNSVKDFQKLCVWPYMVDFSINENNEKHIQQKVIRPKEMEDPELKPSDGIIPGEIIEETTSTTSFTTSSTTSLTIPPTIQTTDDGYGRGEPEIKYSVEPGATLPAEPEIVPVTSVYPTNSEDKLPTNSPPISTYPPAPETSIFTIERVVTKIVTIQPTIIVVETPTTPTPEIRPLSTWIETQIIEESTPASTVIKSTKMISPPVNRKLTLPPDLHRGKLRLPPADAEHLPHVKDKRSNIWQVPADPDNGIDS